MRFQMSTPARIQQHDAQLRPLVDDLIAVLQVAGDETDTEAVERAVAFAVERHAAQVRKSGEPYVVRPLGVARICAELRAETPVIVAALLHDTVEDTETTLEEIAAELGDDVALLVDAFLHNTAANTETTLEEIAAEFGDDVALLVDGVTKLSRIHFDSREQAQAESYRKMVLSMARDVRVVIVKLADRLHNMRT